MFATIVTSVPLLDFALSHLLCTPDSFGFVPISAAMAIYTNLVVVNAFLHMLLADLGTGVLMTTVTGVAAVVAVDVTAFAFCGVVPIETKESIVVESGRDPAFPGVALAAVALDLPMQGVSRVAVTAVALLHHCRFK